MESQKPKTNYRLLTKFIGIIPSLNLLYEKKDMQKEVDFSEKGYAWAEKDGALLLGSPASHKYKQVKDDRQSH